MSALQQVATVLGDTRQVVRWYPDGSCDCPWCNHPVVAPATRCENPGCDAFPGWSPSALAEHRAKRTLAEAEEARRRRNHAMAMERIVEEREHHEAWQAEQVDEARRRGACVRCLFQSGHERAKFIRHRGTCPKESTR